MEAAFFRPQTGCYDDLFQEAVALSESLSQNHPFVDGNRRTSLATADIFLLMNGWRLIVEDDEAFAFIIGRCEAGEFIFEFLDEWIRAKARPLNPDSP